MTEEQKFLNKTKNYSEYAKFISELSKPELVDLIIGTRESTPIITRNEPTYSRPQILWALNKLSVQDNFQDNDKFVDEIMNKIEGMKWDKFYNYDYLRFDVKKPSLYWASIIVLLALIGLIYTTSVIFGFVINLF